MPESETGKKLTKLVKTLDKLLADIKKGVGKVSQAMKELKEDRERREE